MGEPRSARDGITVKGGAATGGTVEGLAVSERHMIDACSCCGTRARYDDMDEAYYCPKCRVWLDEPCSDSSCFVCRGLAEMPRSGLPDRAGPRRRRVA